MAFIDEIPDAVTAALPDVQEWQDGTDDTLWNTKRLQAQSLYNLRFNSGQLTWSVFLHKLLFDAISEDEAVDARVGLLTLAAHAVIWADQIDARV